MTNIVATPKTLHGAIVNGLSDRYYTNKPVTDLLEVHIKDFLSQKFTSAMMTKDAAVVAAMEALWKEITKKDIII